MRFAAFGLVAALALSACAAAEQATQVRPRTCAELAALELTDVSITTASWEMPGEGWTPAAAAGGQTPANVSAPFCRVQGVIETEIEFELWLPDPAAWNGKFLGAGVGGDAGAFNFNDLPRGVARGYAAATTNTGHRRQDVNWMLGAPERLANYELRANHLLAVVSKQIIDAHYGRMPAYSYFIGCSGGGRQGLKEMQRFPGDYDGIISGANGPRTPEMTARRMWELRERDRNPGLMSAADWRLIADAGVAACDGLDGVTDGVLEDPRACRFNIASLQCRGAKSETCLTAAQVQFAQRFYAPLHDEDGARIDEGLVPGVLVDSGRSQLALGSFGRAIRRLTDWDGADFHLRDDLAALNRVMPELRADETDLRPFYARGGRVIMYTGWSDGAVAGRMVTGYYDAVRAEMGAEATDAFIRLYMMPGVYHCAGGPGPDRIGGAGRDAPIVDARHDLLSALEAWVERGEAPDAIIASRVTDGAVTRTRPLCPYPQVARYNGGGDTDRAENFSCRAPD